MPAIPYLLVASILIFVAVAENVTVYVVRHGEKTFYQGCLNIQGQERANNFPAVFNGTYSSLHATFKTPTALFANNYFNDEGNCERCLLTLMPISQALGIPIDFEHGYPDKFGSNAAAADAIRKTAETHFVILVAWEHYNIQFLSAELGVDESAIPQWDDDDYDTVYIFELDRGSGKLLGFDVEAQNYEPESTTCDPPNYVPPPGWKPPEDDETADFNNAQHFSVS